MSKNKLALPRIMHFIAMLKENRFPNHPRLVEEMRRLDIAGAYSITQKTIQRDVVFLKSDYGAPIEYDFARRGYYLTDPTWNLDVPVLKKDEMDAAILSTRLAEMILPNPVGSNVRRAIDSLVATSDIPCIDEKTALLSLIATGSKVPIKPEIFEVVFNAWRVRQVLLLTYTRAKDSVTADLLVEPHILAFHEGYWYLKVRLLKANKVAYETKDIVTLAVHRIVHISTVPKYFSTDSAIIQGSKDGKIFDFPTINDVHLRLRGKGIPFGTEAFVYSSIKNRKDGSVDILIPEVEEYKVLNFVLMWPGEAKVIAPQSLVNKVHSAAQKILKIHPIGSNSCQKRNCEDR